MQELQREEVVHNNKKTIITNKDGVPVAAIHGELNISILANFFFKTPIRRAEKTPDN